MASSGAGTVGEISRGRGNRPACTTIHEDRRVLTNWNLELIKDVAGSKPQTGCDSTDWDGFGNPIINWVLVEPICCAMLPVSWVVDTVVVNPINGFQKAELQTYNRRFGHDDEMGTSESGIKNFQFAPGVPPEPVPCLIGMPEFLGRWLWNSTFWTAPVNKDSWNAYWNEHHEQSSQ